jgi:hypothetical protein
MEVIHYLRQVFSEIGVRVPPLKFVVVGTGRCGTSYTTNLLESVGISIKHEAIFTEHGPKFVKGLEGDASWMAVPYLSRFRGYILHQVRHPLQVIDSLLDLGLFAANFSDQRHWPWRRFLERHFVLSGHPIIDVMRFYVQWNKRCEVFADLRFRVEDQSSLIAGFVDRLYPGRGIQIDDVITSHSKEVNSREERGITRTRPNGLCLNDLPKGEELEALLKIANQYGYSL